MGPTFIPASQPRTPLPFPSVDALAVHLLQQRPGRRLDLLPQICTSSDEPEAFPVVAVFARKRVRRAGVGPITDAEIQTGVAGMADQDDWVGWARGQDACNPEKLQAALDRMASAGGLAA